MKLDEAIQEKIKSDFLTGRFSKAALAAKYNCTKWQIRQLLLGVSSGAICKVCGSPLAGKNTVYCSPRCVLQDKRKYQTCVCCGDPLNSGTGSKQVRYCEKCSAGLTSQSYKELYDKRRNLLLEEAGGKCTMCGYDRCKAALHFHHRQATTKVFGLSGSDLVGHTWLSIKQEVAKCDLLCANCHIELEQEIRRQP